MKRNIIYYIITILTALSLIGCAVNPNEISNTKTTSKTVTFSGVIDSGRSADVDLSTLVWKVEATKKGSFKDGKVSEAEAETKPADIITGNEWSISLPRDGAGWTICAYGTLSEYQSGYIYYGSIDVTADANPTKAISIPVKMRGGSGKVYLTIKDDTSSKKIKSVEMKPTHSYPLFNASTAFNDDGIAILFVRQTVGTYPVTIDFLDEAGNVLYQCRESVTVMADCTTDTWLGNSPYFDDIGGKKVLKVTDAMIEGYGTEIVPNTGVVLFDKMEDDGSIITNFYLSSDGKKTEEQSTTTSFGLPTDFTVPLSFCFDGEGNLYVLRKEYDEDVYEWNTSIYSNKENFGSNNDYQDFKSIKIDRKTNTLYGCADDEDGEILLIYAYPNLISNNELSGMITYSILGMSFNVSTLCFDNGKLFVPSIKAQYDNGYVTGYNLVLAEIDLSADLAKDQNSQSETYTNNFQDVTFPTLNLGIELSDNMRITDTLCQDGCLYMLLSDCYDDDLNIHSRGAVVKYDIITKQINYCGWTNNILDNNGKYVYLASNGNYYYMLRTAASEESDLILGKADAVANFIELCSPQNAAEEFYGPQRFVAIRPKKLVIADDGVAFYTDTLGAYCAKNVNRIVTVDLERFAIDETADPNVSFERDFQDLFVPNSTMYFSDLYKKVNNEYVKIESGDVYYGSVNPFHFPIEQTFNENYVSAKPIIPIKN